MPTIIDLGKKVKAKYPQYNDLPDEEVGRRVKMRYSEAYSDFTDLPTQQPKSDKIVGKSSFWGNVGSGITQGLKQAGNATLGVGKEIAKQANTVSGLGQNALNVFLPKSIEPQRASLPKNMITQTNADQRAAALGFQLGEFFIPGGAAGQAGKAAQMATQGTKLGRVAVPLAKGLTEAGSFAGLTALQGGTAKETAKAGAVGFFLPVAGKITSTIGKQIFEKLPTRLIQSVVGQSKAEILAGKDVSEYVLKNRKIGTADKLIKDSVNAISDLGKQIQINLKDVAPKTVRILKNDILGNVAKQVNKEGGEITAKEVSEIVNNMAPQVKGFLQKQSFSLEEANKLRQALDKTLGDRGFLTSQLPYNKSILRTFDSILREKVKTLAPKGTRELFADLAKEITLRDALNEKFATANRNQVLNAFDFLLGGGGFLGAGPAGALGSVALKKAIQSTVGKTAVANMLDVISKNSGKIIKPIAPIIRGAVVKGVSSSKKKP